MSWSWAIFFVVLIPCIIADQFLRGAMNAQNVAKHGPEADYKNAPAAAFTASILTGAVWAAILTAVIGFFI
jgi:hypothetical protein